MTNITRVRLAADSSEIRQGARDLNTMQRSGQRAESAVAGLGRRLLGLAAGVATVEGLRRATLGATAGALQMAEAINDLSDQTGVAGTTIQALRQQADQMGASVRDVDGGLRRFNRRLGLAVNGTGAAANAVERLGIRLRTSSGDMRGTESVLRDVMDRLSNMEGEARRASTASEFFGEEAGPALAQALSQGSGALDDMIKQLDDAGRLLDDDVANGAAAASANLRDLMRGATQAFQVGILEGFDGGLQDIEESSREINEILGGMGEDLGASMRQASDAIDPVAEKIGWLADKLETIRPILATESLSFSPLSLAAPPSEGPAETSGTIQRPGTGGEDGGGGPPAEPATTPRELELLREKNRLLESGVSLKEADRAIERMRTAEKLRSQEATEMEVMEYLHLQRSIQQAEAAERQRNAGQAERLEEELDLLREKNRLVQSGATLQEAEEAAGRQRTANRLRDRGADQDQVSEYLELQESIRGAADEAERLRSLESRVDELRRQADPAAAAMQRLEEQTADLADAWQAGLIDVDEFHELTAALEESAEAAGKVGAGVDGAGEGFDKMTRTSRDALRSMQQAFESGEQGYKNLEVAIQAMNAAQAVSAVLNQGSGDPYTAFARMATMASAVASLGYAVGGAMGGGGGGEDSTESRQENLGTGTVLGDSDAQSESIANASEITADATRELVGINRSMLDALQNTEAGINQAAREAAEDFAGANWTLPGSGVIKRSDVGLGVEGGGLSDLMGGVDVGLYETLKAFGKEVGTEVTEDLSDTLGQDFGEVFTSIANTVRSGAESLGMSADVIDKRMEAFRVSDELISLEGLSGEEQREQIAAYFSKQFDSLAEDVIPYIDQFQRMGEGLGETLSRVGTAVQVTEEGARRLGYSMDATGEAAARASVDLVELAGGVENFTQQMGQFVDGFAPESEKLEILSSDMERALGRVGLEVPDTRDAMWELMDSLDGTTESGQKQIAALLEVSELADEYYSMVEQKEKEQSQRRQESLDEASRQVESFAQSIEREAQGIRQASDQLRGGSEEERGAAMATLRDALATGDLEGTGRAAGVAAGLRPEDFASRAAYEAQRDRTIWILDQLEREANEQISAAERTVDELEKLNGGVEDMVSLLEDLEATTGFSPDTGEIPGYASGGTHSGGLRVVGERGPELEATGPSAVAANNQLQSALAANAELLEEVRALQGYLRQGNKNTGRLADRTDRWYRESVAAGNLDP